MAIGPLMLLGHVFNIRQVLTDLLFDSGVSFVKHIFGHHLGQHIHLVARLDPPPNFSKGDIKNDFCHAHHLPEEPVLRITKATPVPPLLFPPSINSFNDTLQVPQIHHHHTTYQFQFSAFEGLLACISLVLLTVALILKRVALKPVPLTLSTGRSTGRRNVSLGGSQDPPRNPDRRDGDDDKNAAFAEDLCLIHGYPVARDGPPPPPPPPPSFPFAVQDDWNPLPRTEIDWVSILLLFPLIGLAIGYFLRRRKIKVGRKLASSIVENDDAPDGPTFSSKIIPHEQPKRFVPNMPICPNVIPLHFSLQDPSHYRTKDGFLRRCFGLLSHSVAMILSCLVSLLPVLLFFMAGYYPLEDALLFEDTAGGPATEPVELYSSPLIQVPAVKTGTEINTVCEDISHEVNGVNCAGLHTSTSNLGTTEHHISCDFCSVISPRVDKPALNPTAKVFVPRTRNIVADHKAGVKQNITTQLPFPGRVSSAVPIRPPLPSKNRKPMKSVEECYTNSEVN